MKEKVLLCIFGVIPRSIKYTYEQLEKMVISSLKREFDVDIYVFNMNVGDMKVDGIEINQEDCKIIPCDFFEEAKQEDVDKEHDLFCTKHDCSINNRTYPLLMVKNQLRVMYSEMRCSLFMAKNASKYKHVVMWSSDYYPVVRLDIRDLKKRDKKIYTSDQYDCNGYTDGFYMGNIKDMIKISRRYLLLERILPTKLNYESILKQSFLDNKIVRDTTSMFFIKVRANLDSVFYGKYSSDEDVQNAIRKIEEMRQKFFHDPK
jgi:hypothetical protein